MCDEVVFRGRYLHTIEDLQSAIGGGEIVPKRQCGYNKNDLLPHYCLCPVDLERTAAKNGLCLRLCPSPNGKRVWSLSDIAAAIDAAIDQARGKEVEGG